MSSQLATLPHSSARMLKHTVSRRLPSVRRRCARSTPSRCAPRRSSALRILVQHVGVERDGHAAQGLERMLQQQPLAGGVEVALLPAFRVPGVADGQARHGGVDLVIARAADDVAAARLAHGERQHVAFALALQRLRHVIARLARWRHAGDGEVPQLAVGGGGFQRGRVFRRQRLQHDVLVVQADRGEQGHGLRRRGRGSACFPAARYGPSAAACAS